MIRFLRSLFPSHKPSVNDGKVYLITNYDPKSGTVFEPDYLPPEDTLSSRFLAFWSNCLEFLSCRFAKAQTNEDGLSPESVAYESNRLSFLRGIRPSNVVKTSKYTCFSFLPSVLLFQITRVGNLFFLGVSFLQLNSEVSDSNGLPTYLIPVLFVFLVCLARELVEDLARWRCDEEENSRPVMVFRDGRLQKLRLRDITVGNIVKICAYEYFPSDLILLNCCDEQGVCNVETKNADGESNVKYKRVIPELSNLFRTDEDAANIQIKVVCEAPTDRLDSFSGTVYYSHSDLKRLQTERLQKFKSLHKTTSKHFGEYLPEDVNFKSVKLHMDQLLLRGTSMVNTEWAYCAVVYVGSNTRLMKGSISTSRRKRSKLEGLYQKNLITLVILMIFCVVFCAINSVLWLLREGTTHSYLNLIVRVSPTRTFFVTVGSVTLLLAAMIPVDLIILWEIVRMVESGHINRNDDLVSSIDGRRAISKANQLIEDMGNITHIYSDKTGTLTQNSMKLVCLGFSRDGLFRDEGWISEFLNMCSGSSPDFAELLKKFLLISGLCHSVVVRNNYSSNQSGDRILKVLKTRNGIARLILVEPAEMQYDAASPDELALVVCASDIGCVFSCRPNFTEIELMLTQKEIQKLLLTPEEFELFERERYGNLVPALRFVINDVAEFDSDRKRMTVVVEDPNGNILALSKGADCSMMKVMDEDQYLDVEELQEQLLNFATLGLRTLVFGFRGFAREEYAEWQKTYSEVLELVEGRKEAIYACTMKLESKVKIICATGIEDRLQNEVTDVLRDLHASGIAIWMLTGDKLETALSIGRSTNLLAEGVCNAILDDPRPDVVADAIEKHLENCKNAMKLDQRLAKRHSMLNYGNVKDNVVFSDLESLGASLKRGYSTEFGKFALTVTGDVLETVYKDVKLKRQFYTLAQYATVVISCRVTHNQKALLTLDNTEFNDNSTSLAIGDGANDVGMILAANVGVGIAGKEGLQACRSADFVIGEFRHLKPLLFVHGREALRKNTFLLYFCIFRNFSFSFVSVVYNFFCGFSGVSVFNTWGKQIINFCFTSFPLMFYVILDKQLPHSLLTKYPILYNTRTTKPINNLIRSWINPSSDNWFTNLVRGRIEKPKGIYDPLDFLGFIIAALWLSIFETLIILKVTGTTFYAIWDGSALNFGFNMFSQVMYVHHVLAVNAIVCFTTNTWFWQNHFFLWAETLVLLIFWLICSVFEVFVHIPEAQVFYGTFEIAHSTPAYVLTILISLVVTLFPFWGYLYCSIKYNPSLEQKITLELKRGTFKGIAAIQRHPVAYIATEPLESSRGPSGFAFAIETGGGLFGAIQKKIHKLFHD